MMEDFTWALATGNGVLDAFEGASTDDQGRLRPVLSTRNLGAHEGEGLHDSTHGPGTQGAVSRKH